MGLLALGIGGVAQSFLARGGLWDGILFYTLAAILFVRALDLPKPAITLPPYRGLFGGLGLARGDVRLYTGGWLIAAALLASYAGYRAFDTPEAQSQAWWMTAAGLILFIVGTLLLTRSRTKFVIRHSSLITPYSITLLIILFVAVILRLWQFTDIPFGVWYDEAEAGLQARRWLAESGYKPAFYDPINVSGQFLWLYATALRFISNSVWGLRSVSVLFGVGGVLAGYAFGQQLRGPIFGLVMAFFPAVMHWDINFSRIAMTGIDTPFFELLTLFFLARLLRWGRLRDAAFAGLTLGFGLSFYTAFRLFGVALGIFALLSLFIWPHWWHRRTDLRWWGRIVARLAILLLGLWIALMPVAQYAMRQPESYWSRVQRTSIMTRRDDPNLGRALVTSLGKHVAMFHLSGDKNGRHNLPGEPMLDPVMGVLMALGLGLAIRRGNRPEHLFFLILLPVSLVGGIFSLDFEAPQSLRSIAVLPAVAYLCALPVSALATEAKRALRPLPPRWLLLPAGLLGLTILGLNAHTYFVRQANDFAVWNAFSTPETIAGREMARLGPGYDFYLSPFLINQPSIRFLSPGTPQHLPLTLPDALPIRSDATRPAAIFIHPDDRRVFDEAQRLYPTGEFERVSPTPDDPPSVYTAILSAEDVASVQGLELRYWAGSEIEPNRMPVRALKVGGVNVDWSAAIPLEPPFVAEWEGLLYAPWFATYRFQLTAPAETTLKIDGVEVISGTGDQTFTWELGRGNHTFRMQAASADDGRGAVELSWQIPGKPQTVIPTNAFYTAPVTNNGLQGRYFSNPDWQGTPTLLQNDSVLDIYFHFTPLPRPYSVEWVGQLEVPTAGLYTLGLLVVGEAELYLDDAPVLVSPVDTDAPVEQVISLTAGLHALRVRYRDTLARSQIHLLWIPPGESEWVPIPGRNLWPPMGDAWQPGVDLAMPQPEFEAQPMMLTHLATLTEGLVEPRDAAVGTDGQIYVADTGFGGVKVFSAEGEPVGEWKKTLDGDFNEPLALVTTADGLVWVLDSTRQWVYSFAADGTPLGKLGGPESMLYHPRGLALVGGDTLAVVNTGSGLIRLFGLDGTALGSVGTFGEAPGRLNEPVDTLQDEFGAYFVTEGANVRRWQRIDPFSRSLSLWPIDAPVAHDGSHLAWAPDGSIMMTNSEAGNIRRYAPDGRLLTEWPAVGPAVFNRPVGIYVDAKENRLLVTDIGSRAVFVFQIGE